MRAYQQVVALDPKRIQAYARQATLHLNAGEKNKALVVLKQMTDANPNSAEGFRQLGAIHFERGDEKLAERYFRRTLQLDSSDERTIGTLTSLLEQQGRYSEAIQVFIEALEARPEDPSYMLTMAQLYLKDGDDKSAEAYIEQLRSSDPDNASYIARAYMEINLHQRAIKELEQVLVRRPDMQSERLLLAYLYQDQKQWDQSLTHLAKVPKDSRFYLKAQSSIGFALQQTGRLDEARQVLKQALSLATGDQDVARLYRNLASACAKSGKFKEGLRLLDDAIRQHPDLTELWEAKAGLLVEAKRGPEAIATLKRVLKKKPNDPGLLYSLGALYEQLGQVDKSLANMRKLLLLEPNNASAMNFIGYTLADNGRQLDEAERLIRRALLLSPGNGAFTDSLGWVLYRKGDFAQALEMLKRADSISPGESVIIMHAGDAYKKLGKEKEAISEYRRALAANPNDKEQADIIKRLEGLGVKLP